MDTQRTESREELARVLAILIASKGRVEKREWLALAHIDAYRNIGISEARFLELANLCVKELGANLLDHQWLNSENIRRINSALAPVTDPDQRLLVCRLAASVLKTREHRSGYDGLVLDHVLACWHLTESMISQGLSAAAELASADDLPEREHPHLH